MGFRLQVWHRRGDGFQGEAWYDEKRNATRRAKHNEERASV